MVRDIDEADVARIRRRRWEASRSEFLEGMEAFHSGCGENSCPYPPKQGKSQCRYLWFQGYCSADIKRRIP